MTMLKRFIAWIRSWFAVSDDSLAAPFLPKALLKIRPKENYYEKQERLRQERLARKSPVRKSVKYRETKCICGCGQTAMTAQGTLRYFVTREHRFNYRRSHGTGYGRYQAA